MKKHFLHYQILLKYDFSPAHACVAKPTQALGFSDNCSLFVNSIDQKNASLRKLKRYFKSSSNINLKENGWGWPKNYSRIPIVVVIFRCFWASNYSASNLCDTCTICHLGQIIVSNTNYLLKRRTLKIAFIQNKMFTVAELASELEKVLVLDVTEVVL